MPFKKPANLSTWLQNNQHRAQALLEKHCAQETIDAIEADIQAEYSSPDALRVALKSAENLFDQLDETELLNATRARRAAIVDRIEQ